MTPVDAIEELIAKDDWEGARGIIEAELQGNPSHHWLLARMSLTFYEQRDYLRALVYSELALALAPRCPLVLWEHAGNLEMLKRQAEALLVFSRIAQRDVDDLAYGECGEGRAWARGLLADTYFRMGNCHLALGANREAITCYAQSMSQRGPGCRSIYPIRELRNKLRTAGARLGN